MITHQAWLVFPTTNASLTQTHLSAADRRLGGGGLPGSGHGGPCRHAVDLADREPVFDTAGVLAAARLVVLLTAPAAAAQAGIGVRLGLDSFTAPAITSLKYRPGRNAGTFVILSFTASPVRGLRAEQAALARFSKTPKPEIDTFRPICTSRCTRSMKPRPRAAVEAVFRLRRGRHDDFPVHDPGRAGRLDRR